MNPDIENTNIALIGSSLDKQARLDAANTEVAWKGVGTKPELRVWRIEQFKVVPVPPETFGKFYSGDSYIVLNTYKKPDGDALLHDIHFWLGAETTQDEAGTAAYKTVELDDYLGTIPVQHRQIQGHETDLFLSYFKQFTVMNGGVSSGFNHVVDNAHIDRLFIVHFNKSTTGLVIREVPISYKSLNAGDVFVFDGEKTIMQWNGSKSNGMEKIKAAEYVRRLHDSKKGQGEVIVCEQGDNDCKRFYAAIGGEGPISDPVEMNKTEFQKELFRLSDSSGSVMFTREKRGEIKLTDLDTNDVFVIDVGNALFVWVGKGATKEERRQAMSYALKYMDMHNLDKNIPITRIMESQESKEFLQHF